jgi:hypothetical protein
MDLPNCYLFADDCLVVCHGSCTTASANSLEKSLVVYSNWYNKNLLALNASKTEVLTISLTKTRIDPSKLPKINFMGCSLNQCLKLKYLGFTLDSRLDMKCHLSALKRRLYPLIDNFMRQRKHVSSSVAALWYKALIRPIAEYCGSILYIANKYIKNSLLSIENRCLKIISPNSKITTRTKYSLPNINDRIKYAYLIAFFKFVHKLVPIIDLLLIPSRPLVGNTRLGATGGFLLGGHSGAPSALNIGISLYNGLPQEIRALENLKNFKSALKRLLLIN